MAGKRKAAKAKAFAATIESVPGDLQPLAADLIDFWGVKNGSRTAVAWTRLLNEVRKIRDHEQGGIEVASSQINAGIQSGWSTIRFDLWQQYGAPPASRTGALQAGAGVRNGQQGLEHLHGARPSRSEVGRLNFLRAVETGAPWMPTPGVTPS